MSETVAIGILSAATALLAVIVERVFEERQKCSEEKRWYADYFLGRKIDAIASLYSELIDWQYAVHLYGHVSLATLEEYKKQVQTREVSFRRAMVMAKVYLDEESEKTIRNVFAVFCEASQAIWFSLPDEEIPNIKKANYDDDVKRIEWARFYDTYNKASECLGRLLNPDMLEKLRFTKVKDNKNIKRVEVFKRQRD